VIALDAVGNSEVILRGPSFPLCVDWLPDGRLLVVSARDRRLLCRDPDGSLVTYADLTGLSDRPPGNEMVVDARGNVYVNGGGFDLVAGEEFAPGMIALVRPDRSARVVAADLAFPNGMHITPDGSTLVIAESLCQAAHGARHRGRRQPVEPAGVGRPGRRCPRRHLHRRRERRLVGRRPQQALRARSRGRRGVKTIELDRGCFACALGGADRRTLFMAANEWKGPAHMFDEPRAGQVLATPAPAPGAGWP
jgi:sugar lactone lactonase YvrE